MNLYIYAYTYIYYIYKYNKLFSLYLNIYKIVALVRKKEIKRYEKKTKKYKKKLKKSVSFNKKIKIQ